MIQGNKYNTAQIQHEAVQALKDTIVKETASQQLETSKYTKYGNCTNANQNIVYIVMHSNCIAATQQNTMQQNMKQFKSKYKPKNICIHTYICMYAHI